MPYQVCLDAWCDKYQVPGICYTYTLHEESGDAKETLFSLQANITLCCCDVALLLRLYEPIAIAATLLILIKHVRAVVCGLRRHTSLILQSVFYDAAVYPGKVNSVLLILTNTEHDY